MNEEKYGVASIDEYLTLVTLANGALEAMCSQISYEYDLAVTAIEYKLLEELGGIPWDEDVDNAFCAFYFDHNETDRLFVELLEISELNA